MKTKFRNLGGVGDERQERGRSERHGWQGRRGHMPENTSKAGEEKQSGANCKKTGGRLQIGRPRKYQTPEDFLERAQEYLESCYNEKDELIQPITITGMCNFLGTTRRRLLDYEDGNLESLKDGSGDDEGFRHAIKRVKSICEHYAETQGFLARNPAFAIFALKNYGWRDIQTVETVSTEIHTIDPETRQILQDYMNQLAQAQLRHVIDVKPGRLPEPVKVEKAVDKLGYQPDSDHKR